MGRWGEGSIGVLFIIYIYIDRKTGRKTKELKSWIIYIPPFNRMKNKISIHFDNL